MTSKNELNKIKCDIKAKMEAKIRQIVENKGFVKNKEFELQTDSNSNIFLRISFLNGINTFCLEIINGDVINNINMRDYTIHTFDNKDDLLNFFREGLPNGNKA